MARDIVKNIGVLIRNRNLTSVKLCEIAKDSVKI